MSKWGQGEEMYFNLPEIFSLIQDVTFHCNFCFDEF